METQELDFDTQANNIQNPNTQRLQIDYNENHELDDQTVRFEMKKWVEISIVLFLTMLAVLIHQELGLELHYVLIPSVFLDLKIIVFASIEVKKRGSNRESSRELAKDLVESFGTLFFKLLLIFYLINPGFYISLGIIPIFLTLLICTFIKKHTSHQCQIFSLMILFMMRWLRAFAILFVSLKMDGLVNWDWDIVIWPAWVGVCFLILLSMGVFLLFAGALFSYWTAESSGDELLSTTWLLYATLGGSLTFGIFFFSLIGRIDLSLSVTAFISAFYLFILILATILIRNKLYLWWDSFFLSEDDNSNDFPSLNDLNQLPINQRIERRNPSLQAQLVAALKKPPKALVRLSSTYFQPAEAAALRDHRRASSAKYEKQSIENEHKRHFSTSLKRKPFQLVEKESKYVLKSVSELNLKGKWCEMCCEAVCNAVVMECGHGGICYKCSLKLWKRQGVCHMCRQKISQVLQVDPRERSVVKVISTTRAVYQDPNN